MHNKLYTVYRPYMCVCMCMYISKRFFKVCSATHTYTDIYYILHNEHSSIVCLFMILNPVDVMTKIRFLNVTYEMGCSIGLQYYSSAAELRWSSDLV